MIILRIIDTNQNNYFPQKVENLNFKKIHYGGASELNFKLNEDPSFQNHKVELFNKIYLYYHSNLIWQGYITEFQRDFKALNYNLKASGLLIDFKNKRIKKTYVLDDIGDFKNWSEKDNKESAEILYGFSKPTDEKGVKINLLQRSYNAGEDGIFEIKIDENIERLKARILLSQPNNFTTKLITLDENHSNPNEEQKWENAQKVDEDIKIDVTKRAFYEGTEDVGGGTFIKDIVLNKDAYYYNWPSGGGFGSQGGLTLWSYGGIHCRRIVIQCPTTGIPDNAIILSATLRMYKYYTYTGDNPSVERPTYLLRNIGNWNEYTVEWSNQPPTSTNLGNFRVPIGPALWCEKDITGIFKNWWNGAWANYGLRLMFTNDNTNSGHRFYAREHSTNKPHVRVKYSIPLIPGEEGYDVEVNKRYLQLRVECTANQAISVDKYFAQLENIKLLTTDNEINAANILKDLLINHTQKLDTDVSLIQDCFNFKNVELCENLDGWKVSDGNLSLDYLNVKEGVCCIKTVMAINSSGEKLTKTLIKRNYD